jgi:hypothetical protein
VKKYGLYALCVAALVGILWAGVTYPQAQNGWQAVPKSGDVGAAQVERIGIASQDDCSLFNGADMVFYSDRWSTAKVYIMGDSGNVGVGGTLTTTGTATFASQTRASNGLRVTQNITQVSGSFILNSGTISGTLDVGGALTASGGAVYAGGESFLVPVYAGNGLRVTQNITQTSGSFILNAGTVSSTLGVAGVGTFASQVQADNGLRVTQNITQVSGSAILNSLAVSSTVSGNTLSATNNITTSKSLTVTEYAGFGVPYVAISTTAPLTESAVIAMTSTVKSIVPISIADDADAQVEAITGSTVDAISDGAYYGQILILVNVDTDNDTFVLKNACNTAIGKDRTLDINDSIGLYWTGSVWRLMWIMDASA